MPSFCWVLLALIFFCFYFYFLLFVIYYLLFFLNSRFFFFIHCSALLILYYLFCIIYSVLFIIIYYLVFIIFVVDTIETDGLRLTKQPSTRTTIGQMIDVPDGACGLLLEETPVSTPIDPKWKVKGNFSQFRLWHRDLGTSDRMAVESALGWVQVARAVCWLLSSSLLVYLVYFSLLFSHTLTHTQLHCDDVDDDGSKSQPMQE